jgi:putative transposase
MRRRHRSLNFADSLHFVTTVTRERGNWFAAEDTCAAILTVFERYRVELRLVCFGYALMPDHLHVLLFQREEGALISRLMGSFKRETSKTVTIPSFPASTLWRERYDDVPVPGPRAASARLEYMHSNPVRRGIVVNPTDYQWSSARFYHELADHGLVSLTRA